ncbi:hypothetical protein M378DRAFT_167949 [Amanita muscaria Koide BX008]|uniref:Uncharacterized protein n=1 Tax=Amanita muscaria (strain Koide BX008) TaxID=946122 RepID=A0A0C2SCD7_AMAMK|nr:hypothetical protein M378DRAFT_167949 [Amanita muscaria Koide BX008]
MDRAAGQFRPSYHACDASHGHSHQHGNTQHVGLLESFRSRPEILLLTDRNCDQSLVFSHPWTCFFGP